MNEKLQTLIAYQAWRRGAETGMIAPAIIGGAIDYAIAVCAAAEVFVLSASETGAGTETQSVVQALTLSAADSGAGTETQDVTVLTLVSASDAATGSDAGVVHAGLTALDGATGTETTQTHVTLAASEIAVSAEATAIMAAFSAAETATGAEAASAVQVADVIAISASDLGAGTETASVNSVQVRPVSAAQPGRKAPLWAREEPEEVIPAVLEEAIPIDVELAELLAPLNKRRRTLSLRMKPLGGMGRGGEKEEGGWVGGRPAITPLFDDEEDIILLAMLASAAFTGLNITERKTND